MSEMLKSSGALGVATLTSRVLGMVREMVYARFMGDGWVAGAFMLAFTIPNLFRRLLGEGALSAAFIPIFKEKEKQEGDIEMWKAANAVISGLILAGSILIVLVVAGVSVALAVGHYKTETTLMLRLLRVMFPYLLPVCLAAIYIGMLNARGHFFIPAMGATMLNVVMIASVFFLAPRMGHTLDTQIFGLAIGVLIAGLAQAAFQSPSLRREGYRFHWVNPYGNETVRRVVLQMIPGAIGVAAFQINVLLTQSCAFWADPAIVASFNYAVRLMELPQGVFGISLATYLLPTLSGFVAEKRMDAYRDTLRHGIGHLMLVNLLAAILLLVLAEPVVRLLFERGKFTAASTERAAGALACLAPGLVAFSMVNILARAFYALGDTKTPMKASVVSLGINLLLVAALVIPFRQQGLSIANTISATINFSLLFTALNKKLGGFDLGNLPRQFSQLLLIAAATASIAWGASQLWEWRLGHGSLLQKIGAVFVPAIPAAAIYFALAVWLKIGSAAEILELAFRKFRSKR